MRQLFTFVLTFVITYYTVVYLVHLVKGISVSDARHLISERLSALSTKPDPRFDPNIFLPEEEWRELGKYLSKYFTTTLFLSKYWDNRDGTISVTYAASGILPKYQSSYDAVKQCITYDVCNWILTKLGHEVPILVQTLTDSFLHIKFAYSIQGKQRFDTIAAAQNRLTLSQRHRPEHPHCRLNPSQGKPLNLALGVQYQDWYENRVLIPIIVNMATHSHILITGQTGSGKSYLERVLLAQLLFKNKICDIWFADYKGSKDFEFLSEHNVNYARGSVSDVIALIGKFHDAFLAAKSDPTYLSKSQFLIIDEYPGLITYLNGTDKKQADNIKRIISELLMLGRDVNGIGFHLIILAQRPDATLLFPNGSRDNFAVHVALGNLSAEAKSMITDSPSTLPQHNYHRGEGIISIVGQGISEITVPTVKNLDDIIADASTFSYTHQ